LLPLYFIDTLLFGAFIVNSFIENISTQFNFIAGKSTGSSAAEAILSMRSSEYSLQKPR